MYADRVTKSMQAAMEEVERRRTIQTEYNKKHGITPKSIEKSIRAKLIDREEEEQQEQIDQLAYLSKKDVLLPDEKDDLLKKLRKEMKVAAERLDFETAMRYREQIKQVQGK